MTQVLEFEQGPFEYTISYYNDALDIKVKHCDECYLWEKILYGKNNIVTEITNNLSGSTLSEKIIQSDDSKSKFTPLKIFKIMTDFVDKKLHNSVTVVFPEKFKNSESSLMLEITVNIQYDFVLKEVIFLEPKNIKNEERLELKLNQLKKKLDENLNKKHSEKINELIQDVDEVHSIYNKLEEKIYMLDEIQTERIYNLEDTVDKNFKYLVGKLYKIEDLDKKINEISQIQTKQESKYPGVFEPVKLLSTGPFGAPGAIGLPFPITSMGSFEAPGAIGVPFPITSMGSIGVSGPTDPTGGPFGQTGSTFPKAHWNTIPPVLNGESSPIVSTTDIFKGLSGHSVGTRAIDRVKYLEKECVQLKEQVVKLETQMINSLNSRGEYHNEEFHSEIENMKKVMEETYQEKLESLSKVMTLKFNSMVRSVKQELLSDL